jgi:broad specificity phosphatase PhoE
MNNSTMNSVRLYLVRHGETEANATGILQGHNDTPLTEEGLRQASSLGRALEHLHIDAAFASDLPRAVSTCQIALGSRDMKPVALPLLRERYFGIFDGRPLMEYREAKLKWQQTGTPSHFTPFGGESIESIEERCRAFMELLLCQHANKTILACSHGIFNRVLLKIAMKLTEEESVSIKQDNACLNIISLWQEPGHVKARVESVNGTSHLVAD